MNQQTKLIRRISRWLVALVLLALPSFPQDLLVEKNGRPLAPAGNPIDPTSLSQTSALAASAPFAGHAQNPAGEISAATGSAQVGTMQPQTARSTGRQGLSDGDTMLVRPDRAADPNEMLPVLFHEALHVNYGVNGALDPCRHAGAYKATAEVIVTLVSIDPGVLCKKYKARWGRLKKKYEHFATDCFLGGGTVKHPDGSVMTYELPPDPCAGH